MQTSKKLPLLKLHDNFFRDIQFNKRYSSNTITAYKRDLSIYSDFLKTKKPLLEFYNYLTDKNLSARSQCRIISSLRTYFKYLQRHGLKTPDISGLKLPKVNKRLPKITGLKDFETLLKISQNKNPSLTIRNHLVVSFLYGLGCRVSELIDLKTTDINETEFCITVTGKGSKQRLLPLSQPLYGLLMKYLKNARPLLEKSKNNYLVLNNKGKKSSRIDIWRWLKSWSEQAGFKETKNPHSFRHGFATGLLEKGADLRSIQKLLGHSSIETTQIYTSLKSTHLRESINKYHPLSQVSKFKD